MNEHLFTNNDGLRLISTFEGAPRLKARLCEGGRYELGYGVTFHLDGSPVLENQTCTEDQAMAMFRNALQRFELAVLAHVTVPLNSNQFSALVAFSYNVGEANFAGSTVLRMVNQLRFEDAAAAFGMWVFATRDGYKQALRGLLRRRYAEACLFLSYDWVEACADEAVALQREKPAKLPGADRVLYKTPFANILRVAQHYPLADDSPEPAHAQVPVLVPTVLERVEAAPAPLQDSAIPSLQATIDGIPTQLPLPGEVLEDELLLDRPAAPVAMDANGTAPETPPSPAPARVPHVNETAISEHDKAVVSKNPPSLNTNTGVSPPASPAPSLDPKPPNAPKAAPVSPLPPPKPPPIIAPKSIDIRSIPYGEIDAANGAKNMTDSQRGIGLAIVAIGSVVQILAGREIVSSTIGAVFFDMSRDPAIIAIVTGGIVMFVGWVTRKRGTKVMTDGMKSATQVLK